MKGGLEKEIIALLDSTEKPEPRIYAGGNKYVDFAITPIQKYENASDTKAILFDTLSRLMDQLYLEERTINIDEEKVRQMDELSASTEKQREQIKEMKEKSKRYAEIANAVFAHMNEINDLIERIKKTKAKKVDDICEETTGAKIRVKEIDAKNKTVKIEVKD